MCAATATPSKGEVFNDPASDADSLRTAAEVIGAAGTTSEPDPCLQQLADQLELGEWERADRLALGARGCATRPDRRCSRQRRRRGRRPGRPGLRHAADLVRELEKGAPPDEVRKFATDTVTAVNRIFGAAELATPHFRQDTFSPASNFPLFAPVNLSEAIEPVPDADTARNPAGSAAANYRPSYIAVDVRTGGEAPARIRATLALYRLFRRVLLATPPPASTWKHSSAFATRVNGSGTRRTPASCEFGTSKRGPSTAPRAVAVRDDNTGV